MSKHKGWIGRIASELNRCRDCTNDLDPRIPQETDESPGTLVSEATGRTGSWTKRPFLPPKLRYIYRTFSFVRLRLVRSLIANETGGYVTNSMSEGYLNFRRKIGIYLNSSIEN